MGPIRRLSTLVSRFWLVSVILSSMCVIVFTFVKYTHTHHTGRFFPNVNIDVTSYGNDHHHQHHHHHTHRTSKVSSVGHIFYFVLPNGVCSAQCNKEH